MNVNKKEFIPYHANLMTQESIECVISFDLEYSVIGWNPAAEKAFGYSALEAMGKNLLDIISAANQLRDDHNFFQELISGNRKKQEVVLRKDNSGRWFPSAAKGFPLYDHEGNIVGATILLREKSAETHLSQLLSKMEDVGKVVGWQYVILDQSINFTDGASGILSKDSVNWHTFWDFCQILSPAYRSDFQDQINDSLKTGKPGNIDVTAKGDEEKWYHISWKTESVSNVVVRVYGIIRDISQEKRSENTIASQEVELVSRSRLAAVGQLAAGVAHEINNPLAIVVVNMRILQGRAKQNTLKSKDIRRILPMMENGVKRVSNIVAGLLHFSRNESFSLMSPINIYQIIEETIFLFNGDFKKEKIEIDFSEMNSESIVLGKAIDLKHIMLSLIKNAEEFLIRENVESPKIKIESQLNANGYLSLMISNNGPKITQEISEKVFQPFFTTKEVGAGTGLGMSVSYAMMQEHNGNMYVDMNKNYTTFVLEFPPLLAEPNTLKEVAKTIKTGA
ncbi:MAG: hypothetical protein CMP10_17760 [Zetaproteobacteria bacterium]|nr:hypothetical protein [Pseudobdellovibrionaceae bacterium]